MFKIGVTFNFLLDRKHTIFVLIEFIQLNSVIVNNIWAHYITI